MQKDTFNRTLDFNIKLKYFFAAWLLIEVVIVDAVYKFIAMLNNQKIIHLAKDFNPSQVIWGEGLGLNLIKILIICAFSFLFGVTYSYLARKVHESDKASLSLANSVMAVFGTFIVLIAFLWIASAFDGTASQMHETIVSVMQTIKSNGFYASMITIQFVGAGIFTFFGLNYGQYLIKDMDEEDKGRLLGIKWYHYLWLWPAITVYTQALLLLLYLTLHAFIVFIRQFQWLELLGVSTSEGSGTSLESLWGSLFLIYIVGAIIVYLMGFQREILSGERKMHIIFKILLSILVAFVIPLLLTIFTIIGNSGV